MDSVAFSMVVNIYFESNEWREWAMYNFDHGTNFCGSVLLREQFLRRINPREYHNIIIISSVDDRES